MDTDLPYWIAFSVFPGIGPVRFRLLLDYFGTAKKAFSAPQKELETIGLPLKVVSAFIDFRKKYSFTTYQNRLSKAGIRVVTVNHPSYPKRLKETSDAPFLLYCFGKGDVGLLNHPKLIAVVGTRMMTPYGAGVTRMLTEELIDSGCLIVSGMALGVDGMAHRTSLERKTPTIAVLGCGVDIIAPGSHRELYYRIAETGLVVSEMPLSHRPDKGLFPARNRIISGLSHGVVVTEGAKDSGSLITARYAAEQGREVFAVPGPITSSLSAGPMELIKNGATLVTSVSDVLSVLGWGEQKKKQTIDVSTLSKEEQRIIFSLKDSPKSLDELVVSTQIPSSQLLAILTKLELSHLISPYDSEQYQLEIKSEK